MKKIIFFVVTFFILLFAVWSVFNHIINYPISPIGKEKTIFIKPGMSFKEVVSLLKKEDIIKNDLKFILYAKLSGATKKIKAGEYKIYTKWSVKELLNHLVKGNVVVHKLEIPEGLTWWQIGRIVEKSSITSFDNFKKYVFNADFLNYLGVPQNSAEGFLFPNTYFFTKKDPDQTAKEMVEKMIKSFWSITDKYLWHGRRPSPHRLKKIVILASLIEKETSIAKEKPIIAGVFLNRLKRKMLLQCDPTVIYGIGPDFNGNLTKKDLKNRSNPYNTYIYKGLPPTPICSPGLESLRAALYPAKHHFFYFVAKGDGSHIFSRTLKEHNKAVRKYILGRH